MTHSVFSVLQRYIYVTWGIAFEPTATVRVQNKALTLLTLR